MEPERPGPRPGALSDLEAKLLAAAVGKRLFQRPAEPVQLGRYRLLGRLGQGGMSVVFRAHDPLLRREVALKLLHSPRGQPDPEQLARLRREAHALGRLSHPHVVQVFEIGEADGQSFVVMELVRGTTLREWLRERPRAPAEIVATAAQAGRGLAAAHAAGIIHRDFKPENVLVGEDGRARVVDFGLARANPGPAAETATGSLEAPLTKSGTVLGTPAFMAPEQLRDPGRADARSDQFSFCVMVYEALYGERPFDDLTAVAAGTVRTAPAGATVPARLREVLLRGLRLDPGERWPTMDALLAALTESEATAAATTRPARRWWLAGVGALVVTTALGGWALARWRAEQAVAARAAAVEQRLAGLLADGEVLAAAAVLAEVDDPQAGDAWARWARLLEQGRRPEAREAWAHAFVFSRADAQARREALLGLARSYVERRESARQEDGEARRGAGGSGDEADGRDGAAAEGRDRAGRIAGSRTAGRDGTRRDAGAATDRRDHEGARPDGRDGAQRAAEVQTDAGDGAHRSTDAPTRAGDGARARAGASARAREAAQVLDLIASEAPELSAAPELGPLHAALGQHDAAASKRRSIEERPDRGFGAHAAAGEATPGHPGAGERAATPGGAGEREASPDLGSARPAAGPSDAGAAERAPLLQRLEAAAVPREVVALARAGLLELSAATLLTLAGRTGAPTRQTWRLAAAAILAADDDDAGALALALAAAEEPAVRDAALAEQVALLLRGGHVEDAAGVHATRLAEAALAGDSLREAEVLRDRLAALLAARGELPLRFAGAPAWTSLDPAALHADPVDRTLVVDSETGVLAAWSLALRADRLLVEFALEPSALAPGAAFAVRATSAGATAQIGLRVAAVGDGPDALELTCGASTTAIGPVRADATYAPLVLQLDVETTRRSATCRVLDAGRQTDLRTALASGWAPGPLRLELRGGGSTHVEANGNDASGQSATAPSDAATHTTHPAGDAADDPPGTSTATRTANDAANHQPAATQPTADAANNPPSPRDALATDTASQLAAPAAPRMRVRLFSNREAGIELFGATSLASESTSPLLRAGASLVDGDVHAAAALLAGLDTPRAKLWRALAEIRLGRWSEAGPLLERALADEPDLDRELQRWLRGDPALAPALRQLLGESRWLELFARAWSRDLEAPRLSSDLVRRVLTELGGVDERCAAADVCAGLRRAYGRALAQIGEPARAQRAFEAALAVAPDDASGRALARRLVLDLALVKTP